MAMYTGATDCRANEEPMAEMNMTPLIDVMLVLLIMLIITIPIQDHLVNLDMPAPAPLVETKRPTIDTVDVTADGRWLWNGAALTDRAALEAKLREVAEEPTQDEVHVRADKTVEYKWVATVLAAAQRIGVVKLGVVGTEQFADGG